MLPGGECGRFLSSFFHHPVQFAADQKANRVEPDPLRTAPSHLAPDRLGRILDTNVQDDCHPYKIWGINAGPQVARVSSRTFVMKARETPMAIAPIPQDRRSARIAVVEKHIRLENQHDLDGVLATFGEAAHYDDESWGESYHGRNGVREFYQQLMTALPDLEIEVRKQHVAEEAILVEVLIRGTHLGDWKGLPATGRRVEFPLCGVYTFDADDRLAGERIYYDRATVLRQLGVFHEPISALGQICTLATHPATIARAYLRKLFSK
jgi:steroid delta-isomerase-like uncharacterized protein